jgi:transcriptional regulator with XRE-family HTH domain
MRQKTTGEIIYAMRRALGMNQEEFGKLLDSSQGAVSAWERDDQLRSPSGTIYFRLAALAFDPDDSIFFLAQAGIQPDSVVSVAALLGKGGINMDPILPVAEAVLGEKLEAKSQRELEGKDFIVPPLKGTQPVPFDVTIPASKVSNLTSTVYMVVGTKSVYGRAGHGVRAGDILVLDNHELSSYDEILGQKAVFEFEDGLYVGQLSYISEGGVRHLVLGPLDIPPSNWSFRVTPDLRVIWSQARNLDPAWHGKLHESKYVGLRIAQFDADTPAEWKRMAGQHKPVTKEVRGTAERN